MSRTLHRSSKEIHGSVLSKLNIHPLHWDECADSELGPFLKTFNNSVKAFRKNNPRDVLLSKENWRQKEASEFRVICDLACQLAIPNPRVLNTHYAGFSSGRITNSSFSFSTQGAGYCSFGGGAQFPNGCQCQFQRLMAKRASNSSRTFWTGLMLRKTMFSWIAVRELDSSWILEQHMRRRHM
ncbi:hypothetical protein L5515_015635 [Caenorhabditis briggsae]|uniref:Uncharacterized protein n=1 Tax=Caenorhabditis briggsae TaxID=6238 RepID=A0AAE9EHU2_CAEBR|nr:hypothetical protein L5515_015635 [Caenorhabditis briggsae]